MIPLVELDYFAIFTFDVEHYLTTLIVWEDLRPTYCNKNRSQLKWFYC